MSSEPESIYLARRRDECLEKARAATDPMIARLHREFADRYERAIAGASSSSDIVADKPQAETV